MPTFTYVSDFGAAVSSKPSVTVVKFGDGYEKRQAFGINQNLKSWSLTFRNRTNTDADAIESFLNARAGVESFDWTPPSGGGTKWVCREWNRTLENYNNNSVQATFEQVAEP
jgi:phage-related protein